jgi:hypothetical protein
VASARLSAFAPAGPPVVEKAREQALRLHERLASEQEALTAAKAALIAAEQNDREALAAAMKEGREPKSDERAIERAKSAVATATRRVQAAELATQDAETAFYATEVDARETSIEGADRDVDGARKDARGALGTLRSAIERLGACPSNGDKSEFRRFRGYKNVSGGSRGAAQGLTERHVSPSTITDPGS